MKLELIVEELKDLNYHFKRGANLKNYCEYKNISYTSTSRILKKGIDSMTLRTAYNILGLTPERNISQVILSKKIKDLKLIKQSFVDELI
jgi:Sec7-like guanine-nucleotide exchange factor